MICKLFLTLTFMFLAVSCVNKSTNNKNHNHSYEHTSKLTKNIDLKFVSQDLIEITLKDPKIKSLDLEIIYHDKQGLKTTLLSQRITESKNIELNELTENFESGTLAAILSGVDQNNQPVSKVATYDLEYQLEINDAKSRRSLNH